MIKFYQILNFQYQPVETFKSSAEAIAHIEDIQTMNQGAYSDESFYIIELNVVSVRPSIPKKD